MHNKNSRRLARDNQTIIVEGIRYAKHGLGIGGRKSASDAAFGQLRSMLHYKCMEEGTDFRQLDRWTRTTGVCPNTLQKRPTKLHLGERTWSCECCGVTWDRDTAAAMVINILGQDVTHLKRVDASKRTLRMTAVTKSAAMKRGAAAEAAI
jgi:putative transposase